MKKTTQVQDHTVHISRLNKIAGQIAGIKRMIEENRDCPDILIQTRAVSSALKSLESTMVKDHLQSCLKDLVKAGKGKGPHAKKMDEMLTIFKKNL